MNQNDFFIGSCSMENAQNNIERQNLISLSRKNLCEKILITINSNKSYNAYKENSELSIRFTTTSMSDCKIILKNIRDTTFFTDEGKMIYAYSYASKKENQEMWGNLLNTSCKELISVCP